MTGDSDKSSAVFAPLVEAWRRARVAKRRPMQIPGHKMRYLDGADGWARDLVGDMVRDDIPMQGGVDDNAYGNGYLAQAEALWARAIGADFSRFLVGGSTQGNIAALGTIADQDVPIAIDRTSHRSTQAGLVLIGARPVWIYPRLHPEFHLPVGMEASSLDGVSEPVNAFFATSPSYIGTLSDVAALAAVARRRGVPLMIDQAWGAHLDFLPGRGAIRQGAEFAVTSVHKNLLGYSQTAVVSMRENLIPRSTLDRWVDLTSTTSPSGTLLATIDGSRAAMERGGLHRLGLIIEAVADARRRLARVSGLVVLDDATAGCAVDPTKLTLILPGTGADGVALGQELWRLGHGPESADQDTLVLTLTVADEPEWIVEFADLLAGLIEARRGERRPPSLLSVWRVDPDVVLTPREAFVRGRRRVSVRDAIGEVSAEQFCPYPPGVPLLAPGERVTQETLDAITAASAYCRIAYCSDPSLETILIVDQ
jgi:lysine decarboxylase